MFSWPVPQQQAGTSPQRYGRKSRLPRQRGRNDAATSYPSGSTFDLHVHNTQHHDVRNLSAGLEEMVGGRSKQSRFPVLSPRESRRSPTISSVTTHDQVSRRRVALDARNQNPRTSKGIPAAKRPVLGSTPTGRNQGKSAQTPHSRKHDKQRTRPADTRHRQQPRGSRTAQARTFLKFCLLRSFGVGALSYTPAVSRLDIDLGVATLVLLAARWRAPTPVNKWSLCARVLQPPGIVVEPVGKIGCQCVAHHSSTNAAPSH